jgi:flagellar protein FliL
VHVLDNLVLNPANSSGSRFLLLTVALEVSGAPVQEQFKARDAELRDIILTSLSIKTVEQLTDISLREQFKTEITTAVEARFGKKSLKRLYFPQFVVQ